MDQIPNGQALAGDAAAEHGQSQQIKGKSQQIVEKCQPAQQSTSTFKGFKEFQEKLFQLDQQYPKGLPYEPISYCGVPETHLNMDNLIETDKDKKERANYFVCAICAMVVKDPKECDSCQSLFCSDCIAPWREKNDSCPKKCVGNNAVEFRNMHRYCKQDLIALKFKCSNPECSFTGSYEQAISHFKECEFQFLPCKLGCGLGFIGKDMEYHCMKQCKYLKMECENCGEEAYPNDSERGGQGIDGHDCVQVLKTNLKAAREEIQRLQGGGMPQFGGQNGAAAGRGQELVVHCSNGCAMQKQRDNPIGYHGGARCDCCSAEDIHNYEYFYHCGSCHFDMCKVCALKQTGVFRVDAQDRILMRGHGCPMRYEPNGDRHMGAHNCDGPSVMGNNSRCQSSINYNLANKNQQYIYCDSCNIDVCICCAEKLSRL